MRYDYWQSEAMAWGELKETLGHFSTPADKTRYIRRVSEILEEIAKQVCALQEAERIAVVAESEAFATFFENVLTHWDEIQSAKGYVRASMENILIKTPEKTRPSPSGPPRPRRPLAVNFLNKSRERERRYAK